MEGLLFNNLLSQAQIEGISGGLGIKSVQRGYFSGSGTVTISEVNVDNSILVVNNSCGRASNNWAANYGGYAVLTDATTITFTSAAAADVVFGWQVIEFKKLKSIQRGTRSVTVAGSHAVPISTVDTAKTLLFVSNSFGNCGHTDVNLGGYVVLTDATTVTITAYTMSGAISAMTYVWQVAEFN